MLVSVIIPIYNVEPYLRQCIDSVVNQTYQDLEIILVDDGSTDKCPKICDEYANKDNRIRTIHKQNEGPAAARGSGVESAKGNYIMFLDGDDWLSENAIERCLQKLETEKSAECAIFSYVREYKGNSLVSHVLDNTYIQQGMISAEAVHRRLFGLIGEELRHPERMESVGSCCMKLYRADIAKKGRAFDITLIGSSEDTLFNIFAISGCNHIIYLDEPLYHYRKLDATLTSSYRPKLISQWETLFQIMESFIEEHELGQDYRTALKSRVALSVYGIGMNELGSPASIKRQIRTIRSFITSNRYQEAVHSTEIWRMPLPWQVLLTFSKHRFAAGVWSELKCIQFIRKRL